MFLTFQWVSGWCALLQFNPADNACYWLIRQWVAGLPNCFSSLLTMPVCDSSACEWPLCLVVFQTCCWCLSLTLQTVSSVTHCISIYWCFLFLTFQHVSGCCALLHPKPAENAYLWLTRKWVAAMLCWISVQLIVFNSLVCGWLLCLVDFQSLLLMLVFGFLDSESYDLTASKFTDNSSLWLSSMWVTAVPCCTSCLLMKTILAPQSVCGCSALY